MRGMEIARNAGNYGTRRGRGERDTEWKDEYRDDGYVGISLGGSQKNEEQKNGVRRVEKEEKDNEMDDKVPNRFWGKAAMQTDISTALG